MSIDRYCSRISRAFVYLNLNFSNITTRRPNQRDKQKKQLLRLYQCPDDAQTLSQINIVLLGINELFPMGDNTIVP